MVDYGGPWLLQKNYSLVSLSQIPFVRFQTDFRLFCLSFSLLLCLLLSAFLGLPDSSHSVPRPPRFLYIYCIG